MYFESEFASVVWNEDASVAVLTWKKFASNKDFMEPCKKTLELSLAKKAVNWFSDTRQLGVLTQEDTDWFMQEIVSVMMEKGIKKQALIVPTSVISKMSLNKAADKAVNLGLETKFFDNPQDALTWLKS
jgi:hypothetical protein